MKGRKRKGEEREFEFLKGKLIRRRNWTELEERVGPPSLIRVKRSMNGRHPLNI